MQPSQHSSLSATGILFKNYLSQQKVMPPHWVKSQISQRACEHTFGFKEITPSQKLMMGVVRRSKQSNYFKLQANKTFPMFVFLQVVLDFQSWKTAAGRRAAKLAKEELQLVSKTPLSSTGRHMNSPPEASVGNKAPIYIYIYFKYDLPLSSPAKSKASPGGKQAGNETMPKIRL